MLHDLVDFRQLSTQSGLKDLSDIISLKFLVRKLIFQVRKLVFLRNIHKISIQLLQDFVVVFYYADETPSIIQHEKVAALNYNAEQVSNILLFYSGNTHVGLSVNTGLAVPVLSDSVL